MGAKFFSKDLFKIVISHFQLMPIYLFHLQYECCGLNGQQDYLEKGDKLPSSCCYLGDCSDSDNIFPKGCEVMSIKFIDSQSDNLILSLVGLVAFEVGELRSLGRNINGILFVFFRHLA